MNFVFLLYFTCLVVAMCIAISLGFTVLGYIFWAVTVAIVLLPIGVLIYGPIYRRKKEAEVRPLKFYEECLRQNITELSSSASIEKAKLIARQLGCAEHDLQQLFSKGKSMKDAIQQEKEDSEVQYKRWQLEQKERESKKYANYFGREKRIAMLDELLSRELEIAREYKDQSAALTKAVTQKEQDWATKGGIAAGLAGGAAGLAVAMDAQRNNENIRARNAANLRTIAPLTLSLSGRESSALERAERYRKEIRETETKLVAELPANELIKALEFGKPTVDISETGAFTVEVEVSKPEALHIYDTVPAVIDGTLAANVYQNEKYVGTVLLVLPCYGIDKHRQTLQGICLSRANKDLTCRVEFEPYKLWAIEQ